MLYEVITNNFDDRWSVAFDAEISLEHCLGHRGGGAATMAAVLDHYGHGDLRGVGRRVGNKQRMITMFIFVGVRSFIPFIV